MSLVRQNFHDDSEANLNVEVNRALNLSHAYLATACYYDRDDVALGNLHKYFMELSENKRELAFKLIHYINERGGQLNLKEIQKPPHFEFASPAEALLKAVHSEKETNTAFVALCEHAEKNDDPHLSDFVEEELLEPLVSLIKKLSDLHTNAKRTGPGLGEYVFNHEMSD